MTSILQHEKRLLFYYIKRKLQLARTHDKENTVREIVKSIKTNEILEYVSIVDLDIGDKRFEGMIRDAVFCNRHVKELSFVSTVVDLKQLSHGIRKSKGLEVLGFTNCTFNDTEPEHFARVLQANRKLREFYINGLPLTNSEGGDGAAFALARALRFRSSLKEFTLYNCKLTSTGFRSINEALQQHSALETLQLESDETVLTEESAELLAKGIEENASLIKLDLDLSFVSPNCTRSLLDALTKNKTLKDVRLFNMQLDPHSSVAISHCMAENDTIEKLSISGTVEENIEEVDVHHNADIDLVTMSQALIANQSLKSFTLSSCILRLDDTSIVSLAGHHNSTLERLALIDSYIDAATVSQVCRIIEKCSGLKSCDLSGHVAIDSKTLVSLLKCVNQNQSLEGFGLANTQIGDISAEILSEFICGQRTLNELALHDNKFTDDGFVTLGRALVRNTTLEYMTLEDEDSIGERGIRAILDGLKENSSLTDVTFFDGKLSQSQENELEFYAARNEHLRPLLKESLCLGLWPRALHRASKYRYYRDDEDDDEEEPFQTPDMLYFLVREKHAELLSNVRRSRKRKRGHPKEVDNH